MMSHATSSSSLPHAWSSGSLNASSDVREEKAEDVNMVVRVSASGQSNSQARNLASSSDAPTQSATLPPEHKTQVRASQLAERAPPARFDPQSFSHHQVPRNLDLAQEFAKGNHAEPT